MNDLISYMKELFCFKELDNTYVGLSGLKKNKKQMTQQKSKKVQKELNLSDLMRKSAIR